jgi:hypothetical protein
MTGGEFEQRLLALPAVLVVTEDGLAVVVVLPVDRPTRVAVETRAVRSPGDVIRE